VSEEGAALGVDSLPRAAASSDAGHAAVAHGAAAAEGAAVTTGTDLRSEGHGSALPADQDVEELALERTIAHDEVVVLDYGGQYSQLIARRLRECGVFSELLPHHVGVDEVRRRNPKGLVLSGGPASVYSEGAPG
jgi:carbamoylphosphate synthase small subunit